MRTIFDKNEIIIYGDHAEIILYKNNVEIERSVIDIEDVERVSTIKWRLSKERYAIATSKDNTCIFLHNFILNRNPNKVETVDHINRCRLDNRKENLGVVSFTENAINKGKQSNNTSGYVGIYYSQDRHKYEAHIKLNGKKINLGRFIDIDDAVVARKNAEIKYFGYNINREFDKNTVFKKGMRD